MSVCMWLCGECVYVYACVCVKRKCSVNHILLFYCYATETAISLILVNISEKY